MPVRIRLPRRGNLVNLVLKDPVTLGEHGSPVTELAFREKICGGDLRGIKVAALTSEMLVDDLLKIAARLSGQPDALFLRLSQRDIFSILETVGGFYTAGLEIGSGT